MRKKTIALRLASRLTSRRGFTLVELLVAMALVVFIMVIVSETFVAALESVRLQKAQAELRANLRGASITLRADLTAAHFDSGAKTPSHELSEQVNLTGPNLPPTWGYFRIMQGSPPVDAPNYTANYVCENPAEQPVYRTHTATDHVLAMTRWNPNNQQWYEVAWFLQPNGATAGNTTLYALYRHETPLVGLPVQDGTVNDLSVPSNRFGMQFVNWQSESVPANSFGGVGPNPIAGAPVAQVNYVAGAAASWGMPTWQQAWQQRLGGGTGSPYVVALDPFWATNTAVDFTNPLTPRNTAIDYNTEFANTVPLANVSPVGDDIVLTNVLSFDIRVSIRTKTPDLEPLPTDFIDLFDVTKMVAPPPSPPNPPPPNPEFWDPNNVTSGRPAVFDTWFQWRNKPLIVAGVTQWNTAAETLNVPLPIQIVAVQITIRVWDERTEQARQVTVVQNM
jgi:prepilin-type N-terminal cleavage/methylation domain-containing protein